jgi:hypothetical protein
MKYFKMIIALVSFLIFTNIVVAENQRTRANPDVNIEVRSVEDTLKKCLQLLQEIKAKPLQH